MDMNDAINTMDLSTSAGLRAAVEAMPLGVRRKAAGYLLQGFRWSHVRDLLTGEHPAVAATRLRNETWHGCAGCWETLAMEVLDEMVRRGVDL
jgi:hypothetical protein